MSIIAVDDERFALLELEEAIKSIVQDTEVACFPSAEDALEYAQSHIIDIAFLDIKMRGMNGLALAKQLKDIQGTTNIIFVTGYDHYMKNAFDIHASGYILKPISSEHVKCELDNLRHPVQRLDKGIRIQCFGRFEIFTDGKPVRFARSKSKEILAYLVDGQGAIISKKELAAILWEDEHYTRNKQIQLQTLISDMLHSLREAGAEDIIIRHRGLYSLDTEKVTCDYYRYKQGYIEAINSYHGEYMSNYSWAEFTAAALTNKHLKL